jgi:hypothetical protein
MFKNELDKAINLRRSFTLWYSKYFKVIFILTFIRYKKT